eukprot:UN00873
MNNGRENALRDKSYFHGMLESNNPNQNPLRLEYDANGFIKQEWDRSNQYVK